MNAMPQAGDAIRELQELLGHSGLLQAADQVAPFLTDQRRLYRGRALAVAQPRNTLEVAAVVACCARHRIGLVPQGGNTGYCGGATPDESGTQLLLSLRRLNRIRELDAGNFSMTVEAGCVLASVQQAAQGANRYFPLRLGSEGSCQIGGNLSTNAGGLNVLRFGMMRDLVLGLEVVLPDGRICNALSGLRKNNTGYDLKSLFIGAEGTLGVITAATLKLWPQQHSVATACVALRDLPAAVELLAQLRATAGDQLNSFELLPGNAIELAIRLMPELRAPLPPVHGWYVLIELASSADEAIDERLEQSLESAATAGLLQDTALARSEAQRLALWRLREGITEMQRHLGPSIKHDISLPITKLPEFVQQAGDWVRTAVPDGILICYGHLGDGSLHFNIGRPAGAGDQAFLARATAITRRIHDLVSEFGGSISAEHGIGRLKIEELRRYKSPVEIELMQAIKRELDPLNIMNPGKLL